MVGTGYVGLVSGVCFAEIGHHVTCIDINPEIIKKLKNGESPIYEPGLSELIQKNYHAKRVFFSTDYSSVKDSKVIFLGVGTPSSPNGSADLSYLKEAAICTAKELSDGAIVVIKSTVPVGTHKEIHKLIAEHTKKKFHIVNNPEFLKEGSAIDDFMKPDRVVIGCNDPYAAEMMKELYAPLMLQGHPVQIMSNLSAEMTKYASNAMLATKISFINEIARLCDLTGADVEEVRLGMASDRRIGPHFIYAGPGYGGSCFPKDVKALIYTAKEYGLNMQVANAVEAVNYEQKLYMFKKIQKHFNNNLKGKKIGVWGVSFKPNTDDIRDTPAINMLTALSESGANVTYFDPEGAKNFDAYMKQHNVKNVTSVATQYDAVQNVDALLLITEWREFRAPDFDELKKRMNGKVIFDARNIYNPRVVRENGFTLYTIGKNIEKHS